jgi:tyrosyl-tRNA synthetase
VQAFGGSEDWSAVPSVTVPAEPIRLLDLVEHEEIRAFGSKRQARQRIESGAVKVDGRPVLDPMLEFQPAAFPTDGLRLQAGKKCRFRVLMTGH